MGVDLVDLKMLITLATVFLAFYINQCFARYQQMYMLCRKMSGTVHDFAYQARLFMRDVSDMPFDRLGCRFLGAAMMICFAELRNGREVPMTADQWKRLVEIGLVKREEVEFLRNIPSTQRLLILLHTTGDVCKVATRESGPQANLITMEAVKQLLLFRQYHQELIDTLDLPVPFQYHHLLTGTVTGTLIMLAYGMAMTDSCLSPCMFIMISLTFIGMMEIAAQLWNPFGKDAVDFPVNKWVADCLDGLGAIIDYEHDGAKEMWKLELQEEQRARTRFVLGRAEVDSLLGTYSRRWATLDSWFPSAPEGYRSLQPFDGAEPRAELPAGDAVEPKPAQKKPGGGMIKVGSARSALKHNDRSEKQKGEFALVPGEKAARTWQQEFDGLKGIFLQKINVLLIFVPIGIMSPTLGLNSGMVFGFNFLGIIPLASVLGSATEALAVHTGQLVGGLLNATFGNAVEMIMCVQAIKAGLIRVVQGNLLGSVLSNLLLVLGMALLGAGLKFKDLAFNAQGAQANMVCQVVASISLVLPTMFRMAPDTTDREVLELSRYCAIFLIATYALFLYFQLGTHAEFFTEEGAEEEEAEIGVSTAVVLLASCTLVVAAASEFLVDSIEDVSENYGLPKSFIGIILLPIVGNAAEHVTAVSCAMRGMMDLALGVAVGSSTQVSLFVVPFTVLSGWATNQPMTLQFRTFDTSCFILSVFLVQSVLLNGHTNWLHGCMLLTTYLLIAGIVWFIPEE
eukprot:TRINITY_DN24160_c0_g1_i1.p1 TRINITY_DN24160_c0_g1~~TRINITY_DN24160_c0_g1_i1.p1  ORF type:complete len:833 (-),score=131.23 TRINITY_DN24160_c0_g1_i1:134-2350(-)